MLLGRESAEETVGVVPFGISLGAVVLEKAPKGSKSLEAPALDWSVARVTGETAGAALGGADFLSIAGVAE